MNYAKFENLIYYWAGRKSFETGLDRDDLISDFNLEFLKAQSAYDPTKGKFSTYLVTRFNWIIAHKLKTARLNNARLSNIGSANQRYLVPGEAGNNTKSAYFSAPENPGLNPERRLLFKEMISGLSEDARMVLDVAWNAPAEILKWARAECPTNRTTKKHIRRYLKTKGWKDVVITGCFREIRIALKGEHS